MRRAISISIASLILAAAPRVARCQGSGTFRPDGDGTATGWATGGTSDTLTLWGNLDDDPDAHDDDATYVDGPDSTNRTMWLALSGLPAFFDGASNVDNNVQHKEVGSGDDRIAVRYRVVDGDGSTTGITDWTTSTSLTNDGPSYEQGLYLSVAISGVNTGTSWEGAYLAVEQSYSKFGGPDATAFARITAVEVNVTFVPSVRYWVGTQDGGDGTWDDPLCWAATSCGTGGAGVPANAQWAAFDGGRLEDALIDTAIEREEDCHRLRVHARLHDHPERRCERDRWQRRLLPGRWNVRGE